MAKSKISIHPSTLGVDCDRFYLLYYKEKPPETLRNENAVRGIQDEEIVNEAIRMRKEYIIDGRTYFLPHELLRENAELQYKIQYQINDDIEISGRCDYYDGMNIIDFKSRFQMDIDDKDKLQLMAYAYPFIINNHPLQTGIFFIRFGIIKWVTQNPEMIIKKINSECERIWNIINDGKSKKKIKGRGNWMCYYCPYSISCPDEPATIKELKKNPEAIARKFIQITSKYEAMKEMIRKFVEVNKNNIKTPDFEIGFFTTQIVEADESAIFMEVANRKLNVFEFFKLNKIKIKSLSRKYEWLANYISIKNGKPRFNIKTKKGEQNEDGEE